MVVKVPQKESRRREPKPRSHTLRVVTELGEQIVSGKLPQGSLLPGDSELCERFGVSRTVLREALKTLSGKGLLQARPRIGTRVRPQADWNLFDSEVLVWLARLGFTRAFLGHLGEMRMALEPEAAAMAARRRTPEQLGVIRQWIERMADPMIEPDAFVRADLGLHLAIAEAARNPFFVAISTLIEVALVAMLRASSPAENAESLARSVAQHRAIADAIERGDARAAHDAMQAVVQQGIDRSRS